MKEKSKSEVVNSILAGCISGSIAALVFQPFEYVKTRLQQPQSYKYGEIKRIYLIIRSTMETPNSQTTCKISNLTRFWYGLTPSLGRSIPVAGIYFGCINFLSNSNMLAKNPNSIFGIYPLVNSFVVGGLSKIISETLTYPLHLIKTRYESNMYNYLNLRHSFKSIANSEGFFGLFTGLRATLIRDVSYSGVYYSMYTKLKTIDNIKEYFPLLKQHNTVYFSSCAFISGFVACIVTQPTDVIRSFMQLDPRTYSSFLITTSSIYDNQGLRGYFVGFLPRSSRRILISVFSWTIYEKILNK